MMFSQETVLLNAKTVTLYWFGRKPNQRGPLHGAVLCLNDTKKPDLTVWFILVQFNVMSNHINVMLNQFNVDTTLVGNNQHFSLLVCYTRRARHV